MIVMKRMLITSFFKPKQTDERNSAGSVDTEDGNTENSQCSSAGEGRDCENGDETESSIASESNRDDKHEQQHGPPSTKKRKLSFFQRSWLQKSGWNAWLEPPENGFGMKCKYCREAGKRNPFTCADGCTNYRTSTIARHCESAQHLEAVRDLHMRANMETAVSNVITRKQDAVITALKAVYWLAKEAISTHKYASLLQLLQLSGCEQIGSLRVGANATYQSSATAEDLQQAISDVIMSKVLKKTSASEIFSILTDESTDISVTGRLVLYVRLVTNQFEVESHFLGNFHLVEKDAESISTTLISAVRNKNLNVSKMMGLGSDGASVMVGKRGGVSALLKKSNPFLLNIHCVAHRLALCTSQAAEGVEYLKEYKGILTNLFYYFKHSSLRSSRLKDVEKMLDCPELKMKEIHAVRWFAFYDSLQTVYRSWNPLVTYFDQCSRSKDPKAVGLFKQVTQYKFVAITWFLMDVIPIVTKLNLIFQRDVLDVASIKPVVDATLQQLKDVKDGSLVGHYEMQLREHLNDGNELFGHRLQGCQYKPYVEKTKAEFINALIDNIQSRFPDDCTSVVSAFDVLCMRELSFIPPHELPTYGDGKIEILVGHYGNSKHDDQGKVIEPVVDAEETRREWAIVKKLVLEQAYPRDNLILLWKIINDKHAEIVPNLVKLARIAVTLPVNTAICERGFSAQNNIKTCLRNRIEENALNRLMTIMIEGPQLTNFDFEEALHHWRNSKSRKIFKN